MRPRLGGVGFLVGLLACAPGWAQSAWTPGAGQGAVGVQVSGHEAERYWRGSTGDRLPAPLRQVTSLVFVEHGLTDDWALDASFGHTRAWFQDNVSEGLADSRLGVRYRLLDEFVSDHPAAVTLTARVGAILQGDYDVGVFWAPGDGADGLEAQVLAGKNFRGGRGAQVMIGYRRMSERVPDAFTYSLAGFLAAGAHVTLSAGVSGQVSTGGGPDIFTPDFTWDDFPAVREVYHRAEFAAVLRLGRGWTLSLVPARDLAGRNTPRRTLLNLTLMWTY